MQITQPQPAAMHPFLTLHQPLRKTTAQFPRPALPAISAIDGDTFGGSAGSPLLAADPHAPLQALANALMEAQVRVSLETSTNEACT